MMTTRILEYLQVVR